MKVKISRKEARDIVEMFAFSGFRIVGVDKSESGVFALDFQENVDIILAAINEETDKKCRALYEKFSNNNAVRRIE